MTGPERTVLEFTQHHPGQAETLRGVFLRKIYRLGLASPQSGQKSGVGYVVHGSSFTVLRWFTESSNCMSLSGLAGGRVSTKFNSAPSVPGFGTKDLTTAENDSLPLLFHDFSKS